MSWLSHDITFCPNKECHLTDCRRHPKNKPTGVPVSVFMFDPLTETEKENKYRCPEYLPERPKME